MSRSEHSQAIREFLLAHLEQHPRDIVALAAKEFSLTRQAVQRHLNRLVADGHVAARGHTRSRNYSLVETELCKVAIPVRGLNEDDAWKEYMRPCVQSMPDNVAGILHYGFAEMVNNVIDHSESETVVLRLAVTANFAEVQVFDTGVGIFRKIAAACNLPDEMMAIFELSKGKLTTDPARHSGEGIFFTSRLCDHFSLQSGPIYFARFGDEDWLQENREAVAPGTLVTMRVSLRTERTSKEVFDRYADPEDDFTFSTTRVPVRLMQYGRENLVSRSQARRLLTRFERFRHVYLDFAGVEFIGQGFADEVFRVFADAHPDTRLSVVNANESVQRMIAHATHSAPSAPDAPDAEAPPGPAGPT